MILSFGESKHYPVGSDTVLAVVATHSYVMWEIIRIGAVAITLSVFATAPCFSLSADFISFRIQDRQMRKVCLSVTCYCLGALYVYPV